MECKGIACILAFVLALCIDLTRMECKDVGKDAAGNTTYSIDLTRMECKVLENTNMFL